MGASFAISTTRLDLRAQETRPGVDQRDEILHRLERADSQEKVHAAAHIFLRWLEELELVE